MADNPTTKKTCPKCSGPLTFVKKVPTETFDPGPGKFGVVQASNVFSCADHGQWRVYINGRIEPYTD